jgi:hypothetical protein
VSDLERIERLENAVRGLFAEISALRDELREARVDPAPRPTMAERPKPARAEPPATPRPVATHAPPAPVTRRLTASPIARPSPARPSPAPRPNPYASDSDSPAIDLEALVGRYGTLALATLTILLGIGAFIGWAIAHHLLGPWVRVVLGAVLAVAITAVGRRMRQRGTTRFGNALIGLAVAVIHVDAWGAGPRLHLIPDIAALIVAAAASTALSVFAQFTEEEPLFAVGVGGALLAPFVTMEGPPRVIGLLAYGYAVLTIAMVALRDTEWTIAVRLLAVGCGVYTLVGIASALPGDPVSIQLAPVAFALAVALTALISVPRRDRAIVTQSALVIVALALVFRVTTAHFPVPAAAMAVIATAIAYGSVWTIEDAAVDIPTALGVAVLPLAFLIAAILTTTNHVLQAGFALGWTLGAITIASVDAERRQAHWAVAGVASWVGILAGLADAPAVTRPLALATHAAVCTLVLRRTRAWLLAIPALLGLGMGGIFAYLVLADHPAHGLRVMALLAAFLISVVSVWFAWEASRLTSATPHPFIPVLPLAFMVAVLFATGDPGVRLGFALGWTLGAIVIASADPERRHAHWAVAGTVSWLGIVAGSAESHPVVCAVILSVHAAICTLVLRRTRAPLMMIPGLLALGTGAVVAFNLLYERLDYTYTPFLTSASGAAFAVSIVWVWFAWEASRLVSTPPHPILRLSGLAVAFLWVRTELAGTGSPEIATFLLIAYYAASGVGAVFLGRARALPMLRHAGLALAIYAALKTVVQAWSMGIGLRIGSYFVAGLFMMSVAYWYRDAHHATATGETAIGP